MLPAMLPASQSQTCFSATVSKHTPVDKREEEEEGIFLSSMQHEAATGSTGSIY